MKQAVFVKQNEKKWEALERDLHSSKLSADTITSSYVRLTEDLAYAKARYPKSRVSAYLSELALQYHQLIYKNKPEEKSRFLTFWIQEVPTEFKNARRNILYSFLIMLVGVLLGILSASADNTFTRLILSDQYVDMTNENIRNGDPMAVYKSSDEGSMFFGITTNNIKVSFTAFAWGIAASLGTVFVLFKNGVMLGVFHWMFFQQGLLDEAMLSIWIHGTLEISAIVIAGGAGLTMGNSLLFPGSYPRLESLKQGAKSGLKIVIGLVPFFILAGALESFITRHTEWPLAAKLAIILVSAAIVVFYLFVLPNLDIKHADHTRED